MKNEQDEFERSQADGDSSSQDQSVIVSSRRRLLRAGLKATPIVVATLASRPSLACHCIAPSAWGSINAAMTDGGGRGNDVLMNGQEFTGSLKHFNAKVASGFKYYSFSDFADNGAVWTGYIYTNFKSYPNNFPSDFNKQVKYLKGEKVGSFSRLTVKGLCVGLGITPPKSSENYYPLEVVTSGKSGGGGEKPFVASMMIALIGRKQNWVPTTCITDVNGKNMLEVMATNGTYSPPGTNSVSWTIQNGQIADFLHNNWFAYRG